MAENYKVKSDYTLLKKKSQLTSRGDIYENDIMTITPLDDLFADGQDVVYSDSNFKFSVRTDIDARKKHGNADWIKPESGDTEFWTLDDLIVTPISEETKVRTKPNYTSLKDFAYYGSAVNLVQGAINNMLLHFPAELYFSDEPVNIKDSNGQTLLSGYKYVYNDFNIDIESESVNIEDVLNPYRYMCLNAINYDLYSNGTFQSSGVSWSYTKNQNFNCEGLLGTASIGGQTIRVYYYYGKKIYCHNGSAGTSIRPNKDIVTEYFETIDDFESILLDRTTKPIYKATFETPYETENGFYYRMEDYILPSINNWNPNLHGGSYAAYLDKMLSLAEHHDTYDSNNIWRMMTHEGIKNLDWTFFRDNGTSVDDLSKIDSSKINAMLEIYGRQYDGLKRYIDSIKHSNNVTYNQINNLPDYFLTDVTELNGFDVFLPNPTAKTDVVTNVLFSGMSQGFSEVDGNINFVRNLKLNATYINSLKGTRHGIEAMLGLLGLKEDEYAIKEYVAVANGGTPCHFDISGITGYEPENETGDTKYPSAIDVETINYYKDTFTIGADTMDEYDGIACKPITVFDDKGKQQYRYVIPWYDSTKSYDGGWYYQSKGGWSKKEEINVSELKIQDKPVTIETISGYTETQAKMKFVGSVDELINQLPNNVQENDVCYVFDITNMEERYNGELEMTDDEYSHYFILKNKEKLNIFGMILSGETEDDYGWKNIPLTEILGGSSDDGIKVLYLESIKDRTDGNNPHVSLNGEYDDGKEYIDCMNQIFRDNSIFSYFSESDVETITNSDAFSFGIGDKMEYNRKTDYFKPVGSPSELVESGGTPNPDIDDGIDQTLTVYNPEGGTNTEEPTSYSIVNIKNLTIEIKDKTEFKEEWHNYIENVVMEYIQQLLPSTTIFEIKYV